MATSNLKSAPITSLDSIPVVPVTTGEGGPGYVRGNSAFVTALAADAIGSTYKLVRIPSNAKVKHLFFTSEAQGAGAVSLSVYYSDSAFDGTPPALQGLIVPTTGANFFANSINVGAAVLSVDEVFQNQAVAGANNLSLYNQPLWQALGLAADPGGYLDIVGVVTTTAITTGGGRLGVDIQYID
jgi:hypothetical protein